MSKQDLFEYKDLSYKLRIIKEWRSNTRYSLGSKFLTVRVPKFYPSHLAEYHVDAAVTWAQKQIDRRIIDGKIPLITRKYIDGKIFKIRNQDFKIRVVEKKIKQFSGKIIQSTMILECPEGKKDEHSNLSKLVSRIMGRYYLPYISERVQHFNDIYYQEPINTIRLKNNKSNWGSCSSNRNLNFSTRLLFAPDEVIDYVVVHELAHLKEMNHSPRFWHIVARVMPNYKKAERWLKDNQHLCEY